MKRVGLVYDDVFLRHVTPDYHPERKERLIAVVEALKGSHQWKRLVHLRPLLADLKDIEEVHAPRYVAHV
ncbi:MAG: histone deacetylase, partial [Thermodesulfovibrionales bacterium]